MSEKLEQPDITEEKVPSDQDEASSLVRATWGETAIYERKNKIKREYDEENRLVYVEKGKDDLNFHIKYKYKPEDEYGSAMVTYPKEKIFLSDLKFEINKLEDIPEIRIEPSCKLYSNVLPVIDFATEIAEHKGLQDFQIGLFQQDKQTGSVTWKKFFRGRIINNEVLCLGYVHPSLLKELQKLTRVYKTPENKKD